MNTPIIYFFLRLFYNKRREAPKYSPPPSRELIVPLIKLYLFCLLRLLCLGSSLLLFLVHHEVGHRSGEEE